MPHRDESFVLPLPENFLARIPLRVHGRDAESRTERSDGATLVKGIHLGGAPLVLSITLDSAEARCSLRGEAALSAKQRVEARHVAARLLGLPLDPAAFERRVTGDARLAPLIEGRRGLRIPLTATVYEAMVWAIVGQQVNLTFAYRLRRVVAELAGEPVGELRAHPTPAAVARLDPGDLTARQFSRRKAEYLLETSRRVAEGTLAAETLPEANPDEVRERLMQLRGFGAWSTNYVMMRGCGFADCVPLGDTGLTSGLQRFFALPQRPGVAETLALMEPFAPFRSLATFHLWMRSSESAM